VARTQEIYDKLFSELGWFHLRKHSRRLSWYCANPVSRVVAG